MSSGELRQRRPQTDQTADNDRQSQIDVEKNLSKGWVHPFITALVVSILASCLLLILIPSPIDPARFSISEPQELTGVLAPNDILSNAERLHEGVLNGPESFVVDGDHLYTGTADGWVKVIHKGEVRNLVTFGKEPCGGIENENTCGRPLGMRLDKDGFLVVVDAYYGLFRVNVATGDYTNLFSSADPVNGKAVNLLNDVDIGPDGRIYFTHTSSKYHRNQLHLIFTECAADSRLLMYDPKTETTKQLMDGLRFANGVQVSGDKTAVLVVETQQGRIMKYDIASGKSSIWSDNIPCLADNIRYHKSTATYWVGCAVVRQKGRSIIDTLAPYPWVRGQIAKFLTYSAFGYLVPRLSQADTVTMAIELNEKGTIIRSIHDKTGKVIQGVSEVESANGVFYFGSYRSQYLGRLYTKRVPGF